jgi:hypothetical protein
MSMEGNRKLQLWRTIEAMGPSFVGMAQSGFYFAMAASGEAFSAEVGPALCNIHRLGLPLMLLRLSMTKNADYCGLDSHLHVVSAGNLQSRPLRSKEESLDIGKRRVRQWGVISSEGSSFAMLYEYDPSVPRIESNRITNSCESDRIS